MATTGPNEPRQIRIPFRKPSQVEIATALLRRLDVPLPSFKPHKRNPRERVNPLRRAKKAIRAAYGLDSGPLHGCSSSD
jgi:hypothetical protein